MRPNPKLSFLAALLAALSLGRAARAQQGNPQTPATTTPTTPAAAPSGTAPASGQTAAQGSAQTSPTAQTQQAATPSTPPAAPAEESNQLGPARTIDACPGPRVVRVQVQGLHRLAVADLRTAVRVTEGSCYSRALVQRDTHSLWDLGFFRDVQADAEPQEGGVRVRYLVQERPSIHEIRLEGNDAVEEDRIRETIQLREGAVVQESAVRTNAERIRNLYNERGYFLAEVTGRVVPREDENDADVVFRIREGSQVQVRSINFVGNNHIPSDELRGGMTTSTSSFFSFLTSGGNYREEAFGNDLDLLRAAYYDRGYLNVEIDDPRIALSADRRFLDITIFVREGPRYRLGRLSVTEVDDNDNEVEPLGGRRRVREMLHAESGDYFSRSTIGRDILAIQTYYRDEGYASVEVTPDIQPHPADQVVDLGLRIRRHELTYINRIVIRGNQKTADRVIRRELNLYEGDRYSESRYQASRRNAMALGYFERVDLSTEPEEGHPDRINVHVEVVERPTGTFQVGAGFSSIETFIFTAQVQQLNLFGRGQSLTFQAQFSGLRQIFALRFVEPYLFDSNWTFALDLYNSLRALPDFTRSSTGGSLTLGYPLIGLNDLRLFVTYTGEQVGVSTRGSGAIFGQQTLSSGFQRLPFERLFQSGFTSSLGLALQVDTRDNRLFPTSGIFARLGVDVADPTIGSQNTYTRWSGFFRFYVPIISGVVLKSNINLGLVTSRDPRGVPIFERYFLGGILDVRGYRLRTISPRVTANRDLDPNSPIVQTGAPIGGNIQFYYNLELEFPILERVGLRGVVFHDAGNAFNTEAVYCNASGGPRSQDARFDVTNPCLQNPLLLRTSWGVGLRWFSPLGLLRFEWGFPFAPLPYEESSVFEFTIGNFF